LETPGGNGALIATGDRRGRRKKPKLGRIRELKLAKRSKTSRGGNTLNLGDCQ